MTTNIQNFAPTTATAACGKLPSTVDELLETGLLNQWYLVCPSGELG